MTRHGAVSWFQLVGSEPPHNQSNQNTVLFSFSWQGTLLEKIPSDMYPRIYSELKTCKFQGILLTASLCLDFYRGRLVQLSRGILLFIFEFEPELREIVLLCPDLFVHVALKRIFLTLFKSEFINPSQVI
jgi:hypothetical protein